LLLRLIAAFKLISRRILKLSNALEHRWRNGFMYRFDGGEFPRTLAGEEVQRKSSKSLVCGWLWILNYFARLRGHAHVRSLIS